MDGMYSTLTHSFMCALDRYTSLKVYQINHKVGYEYLYDDPIQVPPKVHCILWGLACHGFIQDNPRKIENLSRVPPFLCDDGHWR